MFTSFSRRFAPAMVLAFALTAACDNPVTPDEEHPEAGGVVILDASSGAVIAQSIGANVAFATSLDLTLGEPLEVEILFLDISDPTDLTLAFHPHADEGESLRVEVTNPAIVDYHDHDDHGDFEPLAVGETTVYTELRHGNHADFRSGALTVTVQ
jgi:hypothetical protein